MIPGAHIEAGHTLAASYRSCRCSRPRSSARTSIASPPPSSSPGCVPTSAPTSSTRCSRLLPTSGSRAPPPRAPPSWPGASPHAPTRSSSRPRPPFRSACCGRGARRESRGIEDARFVRSSRTTGGVPGDLHRLRRPPDRPAADRADGFSSVPHVPAGRARRSEQGHGAVPTPGRGPLPRPVAAGTAKTSALRVRRTVLVGRHPPWSNRARPWEVIQVGNCGPPIETDAAGSSSPTGWGRCARTPSARMLLDLDDPSRVIGALREPLLAPDGRRARRLRSQRRLLLRRATAR